MDSAFGSYDFEGFGENQKELQRLRLQARAAMDLEKKMLDEAGLRSGMDVLDLACGPGIITTCLAEMAAPGRVVGIDLSEQLLREAERHAEQAGISNIEFLQDDVYRLNLPESSFDFVYSRFLFQHLEDPSLALGNVYRILRPGGTVCLLDVDDTWLTLYPEPAGFSSFTAAAAAGQAASGGDRFVGRKLGRYLQQAGFGAVHVRVETVTSRLLGMRTFLDITTGFKREQIPSEQRRKAQADLESIYSLQENPHAWGFVAVFCASGKR